MRLLFLFFSLLFILLSCGGGGTGHLFPRTVAEERPAFAERTNAPASETVQKGAEKGKKKICSEDFSFLSGRREGHFPRSARRFSKESLPLLVFCMFSHPSASEMIDFPILWSGLSFLNRTEGTEGNFFLFFVSVSLPVRAGPSAIAV